jgi:dethiobiotin synthetase
VTAAHQSSDVERLLDVVGALRGGPRSQIERPRLKEEVRHQGRLVVIGGTGTSIGKTHLAEALLHAWRRSARVVGIKPIESGVVDHLVSDAQRLAAASSFHVKQGGYALSAALSPHLAARDEGVEIRPDVAVQFVHDAREQADGVVVELAGGLFTPIAEGISNADLVARLEAETVFLVASDRLGVLHDLTATIRAASTIPLPITGIVLMAPEHPDSSTGRNADEVRRTTGVPVLAVLPRGTPIALAETPALRQLVEMLSAPANVTPGPSPQATQAERGSLSGLETW